MENQDEVDFLGGESMRLEELIIEMESNLKHNADMGYPLQETRARKKIIDSLLEKMTTPNPIDNVTTQYLELGLRMVGINIKPSIVDKIIDMVELIENKGGEVSIKDTIELQQVWKDHAQSQLNG